MSKQEANQILLDLEYFSKRDRFWQIRESLFEQVGIGEVTLAKGIPLDLCSQERARYLKNMNRTMILAALTILKNREK